MWYEQGVLNRQAPNLVQPTSLYDVLKSHEMTLEIYQRFSTNKDLRYITDYLILDAAWDNREHFEIVEDWRT